MGSGTCFQRVSNSIPVCLAAYRSDNPVLTPWIRFYRQGMVLMPHGGMNLPQNLKFDVSFMIVYCPKSVTNEDPLQKVQWEKDEEGWKKWCEGASLSHSYFTICQ